MRLFGYDLKYKTFKRGKQSKGSKFYTFGISIYSMHSFFAHAWDYNYCMDVNLIWWGLHFKAHKRTKPVTQDKATVTEQEYVRRLINKTWNRDDEEF